jgi:hypothetical protein
VIALDSIWTIFMPGIPGTYYARHTCICMEPAEWRTWRRPEEHGAERSPKDFMPASVTVGAVMPSTEKEPERR